MGTGIDREFAWELAKFMAVVIAGTFLCVLVAIIVTSIGLAIVTHLT